ncbi:MAG: UDP-N-acetylmuramate--L-alanine ligase [Chloroflexi bacterium HGW-Chloroflexi-1]|nr:MAG: UDP-N-acetylmuramate--L-alanine ligase [Chloroflexi bacterium HGW-Chloroflexi-1]
MPSQTDSRPQERPSWADRLTCPAAERAGVHIHLVGIGGAGLSAIATLLLEKGYTVSGSDQRPNDATADLATRGATIYRGHHPAHIAGAHLVLISSAVPPDNAEVSAARATGIPVVKRAQFLGPLLEGQHGIGVAGTHGKTTTTSMIAIILLRAGLDPSFIVGGRIAVGPAEGMPTSQVAARAGRGPFVIEADEYDGMFLGLPLEIAIVTNVEWDHVDCYPTPAACSNAFRQFVGQLPADGLLLLCADDPGALALHAAAPPGVTVRTYGFSADADWQARALTTNALGGLDAEVWFQGEKIADFSLVTPGRHNVRNALAALAAAHWRHIAPHWAALMLHDFQGAGRRFEFIGEADGVSVIDDYAHHPTEIAATLAAARLRFPTRRIWAVFQPHTYSRTKALLTDYTHSFDDADQVLLLDIYAAREKIDLGMHSQLLLAQIDHPAAQYTGSIEATAEHLLAHVEPEDVVITMSAGDGNLVGKLMLEGLGQREGEGLE